MRKYLFLILCAIFALSAMADDPPISRNQLKKALVSRTQNVKPSAGAGASVSLQQVMRERNLTLDDNRLTKKAPRRLSSQDFQGERIVMVEAFDWQGDESYSPSDTANMMGWKVTFEEDFPGSMVIYGFYSGFDIYADIDEANSKVWIISGGYPGFLAGSSTIGRYTYDTVRYVTIIPEDFVFGDYDELPNIEGYISQDGSIEIQDGFAVFVEDSIFKSRNGRVISVATEVSLSPLFRNMLLLKPNGTHEFNSLYQAFQINLGDSINLIDWVNPLIVSNTGNGFISTTLGVGGSVPRPIDPRRPPRSGIKMSSRDEVKQPSLNVKDDVGLIDFINPGQCVTDGVGGYVHKPFDPKNPGRPKGGTFPSLDLTALNSTTSNVSARTDIPSLKQNYAEPVYMYQLNDSDLIVLNLFGSGFGGNYLVLHEDGTMEFPFQVIGFNGENASFFYNCDISNDSLTFGNEGAVTNQVISWQKTVPYRGQQTSSFCCYVNNTLYFTNGAGFLLGHAEVPAIEVTEGDDSYTFTGVTTEEGVVVNLMTVEPDGESFSIVDCVDNPYVVMRTDVDQTIYLAAIADGSNIGKNESKPFMAQFVVPAIGTGNSQRGDVNNNGDINIADVSALIDAILSDDWTGLNFDNADCNLDNDVNIADVSALIDYVLGGYWPAAH